MDANPKGMQPGPGGRVIVARYGRDLEDFTVGDVYEHRPGRTVTQADNIQFSLLTMNRHPAHCDDAYAANTEFGQALVNSTLTLSVVTGLTVDDVSARAIANLGWREVKLSAPVFVGDTLYARTKVLDARASKSRPGEGVVTTYTEGYKQDGTVVLSFERVSLVHKRGHGPVD
jgi:acyl dehydratase